MGSIDLEGEGRTDDGGRFHFLHDGRHLPTLPGDLFVEERFVRNDLTIEEREQALRALGIEPGGTVPVGLRAQLKALEEDQKRRATRSLRDGLDRILVDLMSLYRDILLLQLGVGVEPVNLAIYSELTVASRAASPAQTLATLDAVSVARQRIEGNVNPALALEAMLVSAIRRQSVPTPAGAR